MDRFKSITIPFDDNTDLVARVCRLPDKRLEYDTFHVFVKIGGIPYNVTKAFTDEQRCHFLQAFELELEMKFLDQLVEVGDAVFDWDAGA